MSALTIQEPSLVVLCGPAAAGKSTCAARWFQGTEIVSSDALRATLSDDADNQAINAETFDLLHRIVDVRLKLGRLCVVDATNLEERARAALRKLARIHRLPAHLVILRPETDVLRARNQARDRRVPPDVLSAQIAAVDGLPGELDAERWDLVTWLRGTEAELASVRRVPLPGVRLAEQGPFDVVGDVHGCLGELGELLHTLGYVDGRHPAGRRLVFVGDLVDRGPSSVGVLRLVLPWIADGRALLVPGNHDDKLCRWLRGRNVSTSGGLQTTIDEWAHLSGSEDEALRQRVFELIEDAPPYLWLDEGRLLVSHGGLEEADHGRVGAAIRAFCLYGKTTGKDVDGYPERLDWAADYRGQPAVVYGHVPVRAATWRNNTVDIDLGAVFGGRLCAVRWPERTFVTVEATAVHASGVPKWETFAK